MIAREGPNSIHPLALTLSPPLKERSTQQQQPPLEQSINQAKVS